jgi:hypothetical protein
MGIADVYEQCESGFNTILGRQRDGNAATATNTIDH